MQQTSIPMCVLGKCVDAAEPLAALTADRVRFARD
jgi:hypothetical protein